MPWAEIVGDGEGVTMNITKKEWNREEIKKETVPWISISRDTIAYQPSFGIQLGFNEPQKPWKPFLIVDIWNIRIDVGWYF
jgi:hypothetical protein